MSMQVTTIEQGNDAGIEQTARRVGEVFAAGGLVVFPTETVYGIGAAVASKGGYQALRQFKGRSQTQPFTIHVPSAAAAELYVDTSQLSLKRIINKLFPGPVTLVVEVDDEVIASKLKALDLTDTSRHLLYYKNTVGLRCPDHAIARTVLDAAAGPVLASSANRRDQPPPHDVDEAAAAVGDQAQMIIDGGRCRYAKPSTIVRVRSAPAPVGRVKITVERPGVYDEIFIRKLLRWNMLIVCSGNTCRSPMAQVIAKQILADERGLDVGDLETAGIAVSSAGAYAADDMPASGEAARAMEKCGCDLSQHSSKPLSAELIHEADVIYCMGAAHVQAVVDMSPAAAGKTHTLDPHGDIDDPIGAGPTGYQRCAELIRRQLTSRLKEQQL